MSVLKKKIEKANIVYHSELSSSYDQTQPHFKTENVLQVKNRLSQFARQTSAEHMLDIGCGTGFVLQLARPYFKHIYGVDITPSMLAKAEDKFKRFRKNVHLEICSSEQLKFSNNFFDLVTAYGFLHHLHSLEKTFREAYRVLKKGGIFYSDQDPNYYFWKSIRSLKNYKGNLSDILKFEKSAVCDMAKTVQKASKSSMSKNVIDMAEFQKTKGGFKEEQVVGLLKKIGFKKIHYEYTWFWQQGRVVRDLSPEAAAYVETHLRQALPLTREFFKYVRITAIK